MSSKSLFPWEVLKAECLRTVCSQLVQSTGAHYSEVRRREEMISFLNDVEKQGCEHLSIYQSIMDKRLTIIFLSFQWIKRQKRCWNL